MPDRMPVLWEGGPCCSPMAAGAPGHGELHGGCWAVGPCPSPGHSFARSSPRPYLPPFSGCRSCSPPSRPCLRTEQRAAVSPCRCGAAGPGPRGAMGPTRGSTGEAEPTQGPRRDHPGPTQGSPSPRRDHPAQAGPPCAGAWVPPYSHTGPWALPQVGLGVWALSRAGLGPGQCPPGRGSCSAPLFPVLSAHPCRGAARKAAKNNPGCFGAAAAGGAGAPLGAGGGCQPLLPSLSTWPWLLGRATLAQSPV